MLMTYTAQEIANYIIKYSVDSDNPINNLKLQQLLYFLWIDYYNNTSTELFQDEFYAWQIGAVIPKVYYAYCQYAGLPIFQYKPTIICKQDQEIINVFLDKYLKLSACELVNKSQEKDKPWNLIYQNREGYRQPIPFTLIKELECSQ